MRRLVPILLFAMLAPIPAALGADDAPHVGLLSIVRVLHGRASYYAKRLVGRETASGERYDENAMTAAHRTLPLGTKVRVVDESTDRAVIVRINDRGPFVRGRAIDLSRGAARTLGIIDDGVADVRIEVLASAS
jgi:rare lipoprotein A